MFIIIRRFLEFALLGILFSSIVTAIFELRLLPNNQYLFAIVSGIAMVTYIIIQFVFSRHCFAAIGSCIPFYIFSGISYFAFSVISVLVYRFGDKYIFTWLFSITKTFHFAYHKIENLYSLVIFHVIIGLVILLSPLGMGWMRMLQEAEEVVPEETDNA